MTVAVPLTKVPLAPLLGAVKVMSRFGIGLLLASLTRTFKAVEKSVPTAVDWLPPWLTEIWAAGPGALIRLKLAACAKGEIVKFAVTLKVPATVLNVKAVAVAKPFAFVVASTIKLPENRPEAPLEGAVNLTFWDATGLP